MIHKGAPKSTSNLAQNLTDTEYLHDLFCMVFDDHGDYWDKYATTYEAMGAASRVLSELRSGSKESPSQ